MASRAIFTFMIQKEQARHFLYQFAGWSICFCLLFFSYLNIADVKSSVLGAASGTVIACLIFYSNIILVNLFLLRGKRLFYFFTAGLNLAAIILIRYLFSSFKSPERIGIIFPNHPVRNFAFLVFASLILFLVGTLYRTSQSRRKNEQRLQQTLAEQQLAQIAYLKAQINPHFLFNTLNNIYSLAVEKSEQTPAALLQLSDLLRYSIYTSGENKVAVDEEAAQVETYISLFRMRSENPLAIEFNYEKKIEPGFIEPMILIPLVENSLKHTDFDSVKDAFISIRLRLDEQGLSFSTRNTKSEIAKTQTKNGGLGLPNIRKRLELIYPGRHRFEISEDSREFTVTLSIQWKK